MIPQLKNCKEQIKGFYLLYNIILMQNASFLIKEYMSLAHGVSQEMLICEKIMKNVYSGCHRDLGNHIIIGKGSPIKSLLN